MLNICKNNINVLEIVLSALRLNISFTPVSYSLFFASIV